MVYNHITYPLSDNDMRMVISIPEGGNWKDIPISIPSKRLEQIRKSGGRTTLYGRLRWNKPSYTITTYFNRPGNGSYIHPREHRVISAREAARLQSFPDHYIFEGSKTSLCKQIGNAVPPLLAYSIAKTIRKTTKVKNALDLFCGAGGLSLGFEWAGFNIVAANDNFKYACETYRANNKNTVLVEGDITQKKIRADLFNAMKNQKIDIVIGGPPCQGFSYAGKRLIDDPRNFLYKEFVKIVKKINPKVFLMENVEGILTSNNSNTYTNIVSDFTKLGYRLHGEKVHAIQFGVPQRRKRVIIIGTKTPINPIDCFPQSLLKDAGQYITVKDAISDLPAIQTTDCATRITTRPASNYQKFMRGKIDLHKFIKTIL